MLQRTFKELVGHYSTDEILINTLWQEIDKSYRHKKRYYHNLAHLAKLIQELQVHKDVVTDWHSILFSVFYHDIVYNTLKYNNEEKSAAIAIKNLHRIGFPEERIVLCRQQILATKTHAASDHADTNLFTDADLSVLGWPRNEYETYCSQVRNEYAIYPDMIYKPGRKKVILHFLQMDQIFKTTTFFEKYEAAARDNLQFELNILSE